MAAARGRPRDRVVGVTDSQHALLILGAILYLALLLHIGWWIVAQAIKLLREKRGNQ